MKISPLGVHTMSDIIFFGRSKKILAELNACGKL